METQVQVNEKVAAIGQSLRGQMLKRGRKNVLRLAREAARAKFGEKSFEEMTVDEHDAAMKWHNEQRALCIQTDTVESQKFALAHATLADNHDVALQILLS